MNFPNLDEIVFFEEHLFLKNWKFKNRYLMKILHKIKSSHNHKSAQLA